VAQDVRRSGQAEPFAYPRELLRERLRADRLAEPVMGAALIVGLPASTILARSLFSQATGRQGGSTMISTRVVIRAATLAVAAVIAVPAAQAAVPPIKAFPKVFINGQKAGKTPQPVIVSGAISLEPYPIGFITCNTALAEQAFNETTEGTEKGFLNTVGYMTYECTAQGECKVTNTKGEEVDGIYVTAEAPPVFSGTEAHDTGITSLPWTGEFIERETGKRQVLMKHVKLWVVYPPESVGKGSACLGTEVELEDREGKTEKEKGDELAPIWVNGSKNGLKPSHGEFLYRQGETEKGFPITGQLRSPQIEAGRLSASKLISGGLGGGWELITAE
jgi:hypothetical protein